MNGYLTSDRLDKIINRTIDKFMTDLRPINVYEHNLVIYENEDGEYVMGIVKLENDLNYVIINRDVLHEYLMNVLNDDVLVRNYLREWLNNHGYEGYILQIRDNNVFKSLLP